MQADIHGPGLRGQLARHRDTDAHPFARPDRGHVDGLGKGTFEVRAGWGSGGSLEVHAPTTSKPRADPTAQRPVLCRPRDASSLRRQIDPQRTQPAVEISAGERGWVRPDGRGSLTWLAEHLACFVAPRPSQDSALAHSSCAQFVRTERPAPASAESRRVTGLPAIGVKRLKSQSPQALASAGRRPASHPLPKGVGRGEGLLFSELES